MTIKVTVPLSAINTEIEVPVTVGLGDTVSVAGTITLAVKHGKVEDFRKPYADILREIADAIERVSLDEDDEEVDDAAPR